VHSNIDRYVFTQVCLVWKQHRFFSFWSKNEGKSKGPLSRNKVIRFWSNYGITKSFTYAVSTSVCSEQPFLRSATVNFLQLNINCFFTENQPKFHSHTRRPTKIFYDGLELILGEKSKRKNPKFRPRRSDSEISSRNWRPLNDFNAISASHQCACAIPR